jgi:hypothetical protein
MPDAVHETSEGRHTAGDVGGARPVTNPAELAGAWRLLAWETHHADGTIGHPFGEDARGLILYADSGHMSGALTRADRSPFAQPRTEAVEFAAGNPSELAAAFNTFLAYAGRWSLEGDGLVHHHVEVASIPDWPGRTLVREATLDGDQLTLRTLPRTIDGLEQRGELRWERA